MSKHQCPDNLTEAGSLRCIQDHYQWWLHSGREYNLLNYTPTFLLLHKPLKLQSHLSIHTILYSIHANFQDLCHSLTINNKNGYQVSSHSHIYSIKIDEIHLIALTHRLAQSLIGKLIRVTVSLSTRVPSCHRATMTTCSLVSRSPHISQKRMPYYRIVSHRFVSVPHLIVATYGYVVIRTSISNQTHLSNSTMLSVTCSLLSQLSLY